MVMVVHSCFFLTKTNDIYAELIRHTFVSSRYLSLNLFSFLWLLLLFLVKLEPEILGGNKKLDPTKRKIKKYICLVNHGSDIVD